MPRRKRPAKTTRSEHWLRILINEYPTVIQSELCQLFRWPSETEIEWLSPIKKDGYAEYYDQAFIDRLGLRNLNVPLNKFWPTGGPRWDGLGRTAKKACILIEAKAHVEECVDYRSGASDKSLKVIHRRLDKAKSAFSAYPDAPWHSPFYQHANRLAHLYFLHAINGVDAYLVYLYFANAPDVDAPASASEWQGAIRLTNKCLGLKDSKLSRRVADIVIDVNKIIVQPDSPANSAPPNR